MVDKQLVTAQMQKEFQDEDEYVMVQEKYLKLKANGKPEDPSNDRVYAMTTDHIYTFKDGRRSRAYRIKDVGAIILNNTNAEDFMLFFERYDDLHASCKNRKDLLDLLKLRFNCINRNITLRQFGVNTAQIATFMKTNNAQNKRAGIFDLPEDDAR